MRIRVLAFIAVLCTPALIAPAAWATFPGRNGLLAVQPVSGPGLTLVSPSSGHSWTLCPDDQPCVAAAVPSWSSDGRDVAFVSDGSTRILYPDGSCLLCASAGTTTAASGVAFTGDPRVLTAVTPSGLKGGQIDVTGPWTVLGPGVRSADWTAGERLAAERGGDVWVENPGVSSHVANLVANLGPGGPPSWSPDGQLITFARGGWIVVERPAGAVRRLARGSAPVFSPDGRLIAYFGAGHQLRVIPVAGGASRAVGDVRGLRASWQPLPVHASRRCLAFQGERAGGSSVFMHYTVGHASYLACDGSTGRIHVLMTHVQKQGDEHFAATAGHSVAVFAIDDGGSLGDSYDLATGAPTPGVEPFRAALGVVPESVVVDPRGSFAVLFYRWNYPFASPPYECDPTMGIFSGECVTDEVMQSDAQGLALDAYFVIPTPASGTPQGSLSGLHLSGQTVTWDNNGQPGKDVLVDPASGG